jgi:hypothetical protein
MTSFCKETIKYILLKDLERAERWGYKNKKNIVLTLKSNSNAI